MMNTHNVHGPKIDRSQNIDMTQQPKNTDRKVIFSEPDQVLDDTKQILDIEKNQEIDHKGSYHIKKDLRDQIIESHIQGYIQSD